MNPDFQIVIGAARAGGEIIKQYFGQALKTEEKSNAGDLRTLADIESEQTILTVLKSVFPDYNYFAEESGRLDNGSEFTFVIDPLDGTNNFIMGIPDFAVSIGLLHQNESVMGVIYNPILDRVYYAQKGAGAFLNGRQIHVNEESDITRATIGYSCGYHTSQGYSDDIAQKLHLLNIKRLTVHWAPSYDYCLLASGRIEGVISKDGDLEDYAAAKIIISEAGGKITGLKNEPISGKDQNFLASNGSALHDQLLNIFN